MRLMKMDIFIIFTLVTIFQASWSYYISNSKKTWSRSRDECEIATPTIQYSHKDLTLDMNGETTKQEVWVGYYKQTALFEYIGCMSSDDVDIQIPQLQLGERDIGRCYSACSHSPYIGIQNNKCYCLPDKPKENIRQFGCNFWCTNNAACGGLRFISVYKMLTHNDSRHIPEKQEYNNNCLRLSIDREGNKIYHWRDCSHKLWVFCTSDSDQSVKLYTELKSWRDAASLCFQTHGYPIGYQDVWTMKIVGKFAWTGIVWSDAIYYDNEYRENSSDISHGYLKYNSSLGYVLQFSKDVTSKYVLCNGMKTSIPLSTLTVPKTSKTPVTATDDKKKSSHESSSNEIKTTTPLSTMTVPKTSKTPVTVTDEKKESSNESSSNDTDVTLIVGSSVSATLLSVVIVLLLFLAKRNVLTVRCCKSTDQTRSFTNDHGANEHVQTGRRNSNELALPGQISGSLYQSLEAPSGRNNDPHTYSDLQMYCALENIKVGTNNMESEYTQLSLPR